MLWNKILLYYNMSNNNLQASTMEIMYGYMEIMYGYVVQIFSLKTIKAVLSGIIMVLSFLTWEMNIWLFACWILYLADMFLWLWIAVYKWVFDWHKLRKWIIKFILYGVAIIVGHMLDLIVIHDTVEFGARNIIVIYLGVTEALSVLKHLAGLGLNIPLKLINRLEGMRDELNSTWSQPLTVSPLIVNETSTSPSPTQSQD